ncbi:PAS domain-containing protein [Roseisolibacter sp. H3M3-2]|uniref:hybrid sensor histidine kinase/response regulator n=1 Tax=Roseisolibacter sp. H3M3-2 TaxID=3031323 RepID=UPI0023D98AA3|nr:PAS domain-containing protein [Roseisolibacter sp. H3M3-2]MDF1502532.1 PAS domain-containing protein [Roseisolibacter sp. H3M3-2]
MERGRRGERLSAAPGGAPGAEAARALERIDDAFALTDREFRYTYVNPAALRLVGKTREEALGRSLWEVFPATADSEAGREFRRVVDEGAEARFVTHYTGEGYDLHLEVRAYPTGDGGLALLLRDVTARVHAERAERALREREAWVRSVFEQAPVAVAVVRGRTIADAVFDLVNPRGLEILPVGRRAVGRRVRDVLPEADGGLLALLQEVLDAGAPRSITDYRLPLDRDGDGAPEDYWFSFVYHPLRDADGAVAGLVAVGVEVTERVRSLRRAEALAEALRESRARARALFVDAPLPMWVFDLETLRVLDVNEAAVAHYGWPRDAFVGMSVEALRPAETLRELHDALAGAREELARGERSLARFQTRHRTRDGRVVDVELAAQNTTYGGRPARIVLAADVTARVDLEERLRQAQKMEAVGRLAGGVAHDFNNLLTVIGGNLEFLQADLPPGLPPDHAARGDAAEIAHAAERARGLVRQLLAFSRRQPVRPERLRVAELVRGAEKLLRRVIGEEIVLAVHVADEALAVHADPGQLEQVLMNLVVNARDAMLEPRHGHAGGGGAVEVEVAPARLTPGEAAAWDGLAARDDGRYVRLTVRDSGHGMDDATRARAFEPFFTTKAVGAGTGLGLSTVLGIVQQAGGGVRVTSAPGAGTQVTILLPAADAGDETVVGRRPGDGTRAGAPATVLVAEDEAPVRALLRRALERHGHRVLEARHGGDALQAWRRHAGEISAVITDLRMPEMGGRELVARLRAERPDLGVVFLSGYADEVPGPLGPGERFVEKPFVTATLIEALAAVLDGAARR